ncbi:Ion transport protein-domain-containing protein [Mrakia frigida]|uniref:calcium channel protein CCH1 n=1 Tax=Mrakia frigida TaxID=29902 RepID=UPI003FCBEE58
MANVVVLTIQGAHPLKSPRPSGWFNSWEDCLLFALFVFFTLEMFARIIVSGLILDPYTAASLASSASNTLHSSSNQQPPPSNLNSSTNTSVGIPMADRSTTTSKLRNARVKISAVMALSGSKSSMSSRTLVGKDVDGWKDGEEYEDPYDSEEDEGDDGMFTIAPLASETDSKPTTYPPKPLRPRQHSAPPPSLHSSRSQFSSSSSKPRDNDFHPDVLPPSSLTFGHELPFQVSLDKQRRIHSLGRPYLRTSWHRLDIVAIISFWIMFGLSVSGQESTADRHVFIFRALSILRAGRLLLISSGTATILHSLKRAGPLLINVSFFVLFAMVLFSIIGVQSFQGSFRRSCYLVDPTNLNADSIVSLGTPCGGWYDPSTDANRGFFSINSLNGSQLGDAKGFICPGPNQMCLQGDSNLKVGQSFDNVLAAAQQVVIIASANTWTPVMYTTIDADGYLSSLFFIFGIIVLFFWLSQLAVAVVVNIFGDIRAETKKSAFGASSSEPLISALGEDWIVPESRKRKTFARLRTFYEKTNLFWVALILGSLVAQSTLSASSSDGHIALLNNLERGFSVAFDIEIILRFLTTLPDWKTFFADPRNDFDLVLALVSTIIQVPVILESEAHGWLTIFPLARWYRVILEIPRMRPLLLAVFGSVAGLLNMTLFLLLMNLLAALLAIQLFQGNIVQDGETTIIFDQIYNSFLGMYQIFSSENWTDPLYSALEAEFPFHQGVIGGLFLCGWLMFSNFILLQLFIAVIQENFSVAEELKRKQQIEAFIKKTQPKTSHSSWLDRWNPYRLLKAKPRAIAVQNLPPNLVLPLKKSIVREFSDAGAGRSDRALSDFEKTGEEGIVSFIKRTMKIDTFKSEHLPMNELKSDRVREEGTSATQDVDRQFEFLTSTGNMAGREEHTDSIIERRAMQADFIASHPSYDRSLWIFSQENPLRRFCQLLVPPADGERIFGRPASPTLSFFFKMVIYVAVLASVAIAAVATPLYRKGYYSEHGLVRGTWFDVAEISLGAVFVLEFLIKVIADGFIFAPNAYLHSIWNILDFLMLVALLVNTSTSLIYLGGLSRFTRSLKAVRSFRLITLASRLRETFYSTFLVGAGRILDASMLVILYMIPYAVWGVNIFRGRLFGCNDDSVFGKADCIGFFVSTPVDGVGSGFPVPRTWTNPTDPSIWSFDNFRESLLILFEVVSLEGWIDVMASLMNITDLDQQPSINASSWNALFMVFYNLFGAVIILTLFVSIIIQNFSTRSGAALLTTEQRQWVDLKKTIYRQAPAKRPKTRPDSRFKSWCFDRAAQKHGWWTKMMTVLYCLHVVILATQSFENTRKGSVAETTRDSIFLGFIAIYTFDLSIRAYGLGWRSFKANGWNWFDLIVITGSLATTVPVLFGLETSALVQLQRLFLCSIALKLIQKLNSLNQLFKTAVASLPIIGNIFALWLVFFFVWSIMDIEVFGLTKWGRNATSSANFRDFLNSLIHLAFMSTGEGWNAYMHDYTVAYPSCTESDNYLESDCGSEGFAFALFISWDVLSQFLLVNMLTGVVVESFSYVFRFPGKASLTREEIRSFKKTWAEFDRDRTGYLRRDQTVPFFARLSGVLEVRPYPREVSLANLLKLASPEAGDDSPSIVHGSSHSVDVRKLSKALDLVNIPEIRRRRHLYNRIYHEASISDEGGGKGISFTSMLLLISHYRLINDDDALLLEDLLRRRVKTDFVTDLVNLDRVHGILRTLYWRRRFLASRDERRRTLQAQTDGMPSIVLDPTPSLTLDITALEGISSAPNSPTGSPFNPRSSLATPDQSFSSPSRDHKRRVSDISMLSMRSASPEGSPRNTMETDREILASMEKSVWGDMMDSDDE